jgi:hypothetical protein
LVDLLTVDHRRDVIHACQRGRVLGAQYLLPQLQLPPVHLLGRLLLALIPKHLRKVIHARQRGRMLGAQYFLLQLQHPPVHLLGHLILTLIAEHQREDIHAHQRIQVRRGCNGFS